VDISTIPIGKLEVDLQESRDDISICEIALSHGILSYSGGSVKERLEDNKHFVKVISDELDRRAKASLKSAELKGGKI
jgi:hypothetical protein